MNYVNEYKNRTPAILKILRMHSDPEHRISMPQLIAYLSEEGIPAERKAVYQSLQSLREEGFEICFSREGGRQGYWLSRTFTPAEILFLRSAVYESPSLSEEESLQLSEKLAAQLSRAEADALPEAELFAGKTDNPQVLSSIGILLRAIQQSRNVSFRYYDLTVTRQKRYRRNATAYHLKPCSVLSYSGRLYCVCYSNVHRSFANYRIDKMNGLKTEDVSDPVRFDVHRWMQTAFMMYRGEPETITLQCDLSLAGIVFDQFGRDVMISAIGADSFTVNIRSSLSPTLISWILMFYDRLTVLGPDDLINELRKIADHIQKTYPEPPDNG